MNVTNVVRTDSAHGLRQSETIKEVTKALLAFQTEMPSVTKDANNPFFKSKYATLSNIWHACQPVLAKNGLIVSQSSGNAYKVGDDTFNDFHTRIIHAESGEWIEAVSAIPIGKTDPQGYGSTNTYSRRYCLTPLIGIVVDDDDDGNAASGRQQKPEVTCTSLLKTMLNKEAGCQNKEDADLVINHVIPGESVSSIENEATASAVMKTIRNGIDKKTLDISTVLEEARKQQTAAESAAVFPV